MNHVDVSGPDTRRRLVEEAARAFVERGYAGTSSASVAAAAGVSRQAVTWHFKDKSELLLAVLEEYERQEAAFLGELFEEPQGLAAVIVEAQRRGQDHRVLQHLAAVLAAESLHPDHPAHEWFRERNRRNLEQIASGVRLEQDAGHLHPDVNPDLVAPAILALMTGMPFLSLRDKDVDSVAAVQHAVRALLPPP